MGMERVLVLVGVGLTLAGLTGCSSGQTGSPKCAAELACPCEFLQLSNMLTGTLVGLDANSASVEVTRIVGESTGEVAVGEVIADSYQVELDCAEKSGASVSLGDEVFVLYEKGDADAYPGCAEYIACTQSNSLS